MKWKPINVLESDEDLICKSNGYYRKGICQPIPYRSYPPSDLIDSPIFESMSPLDESPRFNINSPHRLTSLIREFEHAVSYVSEGLIRTFPTKLLIKRYRKFVSTHMDSVFADMKIKDLIPVERNCGNTKVIDYSWCNEPTLEISPLVRFIYVAFKADDFAKTTLSDLVNDMYACGYNLSRCSMVGGAIKSVNGEPIEVFQIVFEAKFSDFEFNLADELYHVTPIRFMKKISANGIVPTHKAVFFNYPDRVYLFNFGKDVSFARKIQVMKSYMRQRINSFMDVYGSSANQVEDYCALRVRRDKLESYEPYKSGKLDFYIDACYDGNVGRTSDSPAIFTYGNIPRKLIEDDALRFPISIDDTWKINIGEYDTVKLDTFHI